MLMALASLPSSAVAADPDRTPITLDPLVRSRCLDVLREGLSLPDFWPAMHAAEGLSAAGFGRELQPILREKLATETDGQHRCGLARELVRAGDRRGAAILLQVLAAADAYGHAHAAESLFKVGEIGDGEALRAALQQEEYPKVQIMAAAALARAGNRAALSVLRRRLLDEDRELSRTAAWALSRVGGESDLPAIRAQLPLSDDVLTAAYYEHALAALGDADGRARLLANLTHENPSVRTSAAEFVPDVWADEAADRLIAMLGDAHPDARIRAAHALLALAQAPPPDSEEDLSLLVFEATEEHPRYTEGSVLPLQDGSLLFAVTEFSGSGSDFAQARIVGRTSSDGGRTWSDQRVLQENTGRQNVMSVTLRWIGDPADPRLALFYLQKNAYDDLQLFVRFSDDEARTFGDPICVTIDPGYHVVNNDRVTQLGSGRLIVPAASTTNVESDNHFVCHCYYSDDQGRTWAAGSGRVDLPRRGAMEPEVIELRDGRLLMIIRTQLGYIAASYSSDGGDAWSEAESMQVTAPEAPATIRRIPATGDLLLIWNNTYDPSAGHGGPRTPLTAAVSRDEGRTWEDVRNLEADPARTYAYTSALFHRGRAILTYWESGPAPGQLSSRFRSLPVAWFYSQD